MMIHTKIKTLAPLGSLAGMVFAFFAPREIFHAFLSSPDFFLQNPLFAKILSGLRNTIRVSNRLDPDQARHFVGHDLGPNCLQKLSEYDTAFQ